MKKHAQERERVNEEFNRITDTEFRQLRQGLARNPQKRINGRLQSSFLLYMLELRVVRFPNPSDRREKVMDQGQVLILNPYEYTKWNKANSMVEAADFKEHESRMESNPEERVKEQARLARWFGETRHMIRSIVKSTKV